MHKLFQGLARLATGVIGRPKSADAASNVSAGEIEKLRKVAADAPDVLEAQVALARALAQAGQRVEAIETFDRVHASAPDRPDWAFERAEALWDAQRLVAALKAFRTLQTETNDRSVQQRLVLVFERFGDLPRVRDALGHLDDDDAIHRRNDMAREVQAAQQLHKKICTTAKKKAANPFAFHMRVGAAYRDAGLLAPAIDAYAAGLEIDDGRANWHPGEPSPLAIDEQHMVLLERLGLTPDMARPTPRPAWLQDALALNQALCFDEARIALAEGVAAHPNMTIWQKVYVEFLDNIVRENARWALNSGYPQGTLRANEPFWPSGVWNDTPAKTKVLLTGRVFQPTDNIFLFLNNTIIRAVNTRIVHDNRRRRTTPFEFPIYPNLINHFPRVSRLGIGALDVVMLNNRRPIDEIEYLNPSGSGDLIEKLRDGSHVITKHGMLGTALTEDKIWQKKSLGAYRQFKSYFKETFGYDLFVVYGILLGAQRSGDFIASDDDFDVAYFSNETTSQGVRAELIRMLDRISSDGFSIKLNPRRRMFKVLVNKVWLDCFSGWEEGNRLWMPQTTSFVGDKNVFFPLREVPFQGAMITVPNKPEIFLEAVYGPGWRTPDIGYMNPIRSPQVMAHLASTYLTRRELLAMKAKGVVAK